MPMHHALALRDDDHHDGDLDAIPVRADAHGLAFDRRTHALYVADGYRGALVRLDGDRQRRIATLEAARGAPASSSCSGCSWRARITANPCAGARFPHARPVAGPAARSWGSQGLVAIWHAT
jgi:hypothetical protein